MKYYFIQRSQDSSAGAVTGQWARW